MFDLIMIKLRVIKQIAKVVILRLNNKPALSQNEQKALKRVKRIVRRKKLNQKRYDKPEKIPNEYGFAEMPLMLLKGLR